jgi:hypothetical protein
MEEPTKIIGLKYDQDKLQYSLLPPGVIEEAIKVLMDAVPIYGADNWKHLEDAKRRYYDAAMRHLQSWWSGEKIDPKSNRSHIAHLLCNVIFLMWFEMQEDGK